MLNRGLYLQTLKPAGRRPKAENLWILHPESGRAAVTDPTYVECARKDEIRTAFQTLFLPTPEWAEFLIEQRDHEVALVKVEEPSPEALHWQTAVEALLDSFAALDPATRATVDLPTSWRTGRCWSHYPSHLATRVNR